MKLKIIALLSFISPIAHADIYCNPVKPAVVPTYLSIINLENGEKKIEVTQNQIKNDYALKLLNESSTQTDFLFHYAVAAGQNTVLTVTVSKGTSTPAQRFPCGRAGCTTPVPVHHYSATWTNAQGTSTYSCYAVAEN